MTIEQKLKEFKTVFDKEMEKVLDLKISQAKKVSPWAVGFVNDLKNYMFAGKGGKRIRPALMYFGYLTFGGKKINEIIKAAMSVEFLHACFLIQDDIIDRDSLRHGERTMHYRYDNWARNNLKLDNAESYHFGISQAICSADIAIEMSFKALTQSSFGEKIRMEAVNKLCDIVIGTAAGEMSDVLAENTKNVREDQVINILEYKTARYTVEGPLQLGAIMAGASDKVLKKISEYAIPLGIAFQIQDDILGVFGSSRETGKPVGADIREGKKTLLTIKALEWGTADQKKYLRFALGNRSIGAKQIERVRKIIIETGSLEYSKKLAEKLSNNSCLVLTQSSLDKKSKEFFSAVADFMIKRNY